MYVSSRTGGTHAFRKLKAREFHEMQWNENIGHRGRLIGEKSIDLGEPPKLLIPAEVSKPLNEQSTHHRRSLSLKLRGHEMMTQVVHKFFQTEKYTGRHNKQQATVERHDYSTVLVHDMFQQGMNPQVRDCEIPNANFARKFGLFTDNGPLPPFIRELPVAEDKAMDMATEPLPKELIYSWRFQGPFTPQLWFDSGIDYRWKTSSC